ncbi:exodeoxyribonuclease VII large subunit [Curtanaerobium respiraculi]|uniref:exodeoxyribonuclease VII large subunit n=1 Tax=Curtanaerobium respiraculi TaxID=2949669 RepID=UPI0024B348C3|nr:exodeoxyribonuclease VII large subunit [Curtanaerobium respiraculi]
MEPVVANMPLQAGAKPLSVSQAMARAKEALESCRATLVGEVSEVSDRPQYKAVYFTVKDRSAALPCLMWKDRYRASGVDLRVGMRVQLTGRFSLYAAKGRMNFDVFRLTPAGEGDLRAKVAALARKLQREGLMAPERKRPLPVLPSTIGLVTSPNGAAVHDVLRTLRRRYPLATVVLAGVMVEGAQAPLALAQGIRTVAGAGAEVVLLVRGGGSFEDLMPFNDEMLAREVAACPVPVVTGIGHEPDTSIADMVADLRASTPTAAAEAVAPEREELRMRLAAAEGALSGALRRSVEFNRLRLDRVASRPVFSDSHALLAGAAQTLDIQQERLRKALPHNLERDRADIAHAAMRLRGASTGVIAPFEASWRLHASRLNDLSPLAVIGRGFSLTRGDDGAIVRSVSQVSVGGNVSVQLSDGVLDCSVEGIASPVPSSS